MADSDLSARDARAELYEVMELDLPFEETAERALAVGERYLGVDHAYLARIDPDADYWRAVVSTDTDDGTVPPGLTIDLGTAYCRRTIGDEGSVAVHDAPAQGWADDPAFETHGLHCYHGATVAPGGDLYGTVCFASEDPRERPFAEAETMFVELLARLLEHELERARLNARLDRFEEFASVLSHDIRNPLNVAQGRLDLERKERDSDHLAVTARSLDRIESLIESVLEVAHEGTAVEETEVVSLSSIVEDCWVTVEGGDASLAVEDEFEFRADPERLRRVFENLFRNSIEHGDTGVTIRVGTLDDGAGFYVADDGPGIPPEDRDTVFEAGHTTDADGTGLGLSIVGSLVEAHGWRIDVTDADSGGARFEVSGVIPA